MKKQWKDLVIGYKVIHDHPDLLCDPWDPCGYSEVIEIVETEEEGKKYLKPNTMTDKYFLEPLIFTAQDMLQSLVVLRKEGQMTYREFVRKCEETGLDDYFHLHFTEREEDI